MRPYNYFGRWVDLDTIQSIDEPCLDRYDNLVVRWHHAFTDKQDEMNFGRDTYPAQSEKMSLAEFSKACDERTEEWKKTGVAKNRAEVFVPFFTAWAGRPPE